MPEQGNGKKIQTPEGSVDPSFLNHQQDYDWEFVSYAPEDLSKTVRRIGSLGLKHGHENVTVKLEPADTARIYYPAEAKEDPSSLETEEH